MLYVGDDWAEDHHDVEIQDEAGHRLGKARLPEGIAGVARLHELIAEQLAPGIDVGTGAGSATVAGPEQVLVGIETDRGPWVQALVAAGYRVYPINPRQVARFRERHSNAGGKSDARDAHTLADMVRTDGHQLRAIAGDSPAAAGVKILARAHQTLVWERIRHHLRLRSGLREYFPAALVAFDDLAARDALELLGKAPDPTTAARLTRAQIAAALRRARRRDVEAKTTAIAVALRTPALTQPAPVVAAFAAVTRALTAVISAVTVEIDRLAREMAAAFDQHPDAQIYRSQPGIAAVVGPRVLGEFGDDPGRYADARARKNFAGTSPITRQSGKKKTVHARYVHNARLIDALCRQAQGALSGSAGARAYYDQQRARGLGHQPALRQLANRLVGILHGCLRTRTLYDEATAWAHTARPTGDAADSVAAA